VCVCVFFHGATAHSAPGSPHYGGFTITFRRTSLCRASLDKWSAWSRDLYLTNYYTHKRKTSTPSGNRTCSPSKTAAVDPHLTPRGYYALYTSDYLISNIPSTPVFSKQSLPFRFADQNFLCLAFLSHICSVIWSVDTPFYYAIFLPAVTSALHFVLVPCRYCCSASLSLSLLSTTVVTTYGLSGTHRQYYGSCCYSTTTVAFRWIELLGYRVEGLPSLNATDLTKRTLFDRSFPKSLLYYNWLPLAGFWKGLEPRLTWLPAMTIDNILHAFYCKRWG